MSEVLERPRRAVVVDDDPVNLYYAGKVLRGGGWEVASAKSYLSALQAVTDTDCNLLLADIRLGEGSGFELVRIVREWRPAVRVLLMTAYRDEELRAVDAGLPVIRVPFSSRDLVTNVRHVLI